MKRVPKIHYLTEGEKLMLTRRRKGLTQAELAEDIGVSQMSISNFEHEKAIIPKGFSKKWFKIKGKDLTKGENMLMLRIRWGLSVKEMSIKLGICHVKYLEKEKEK